MEAIKDFFGSLMLAELLGMRLTGKYFFKRKVTLRYPQGKKTPTSGAFPQPAHAASLPQRGRALHRVQTVWLNSRPALAITIESDQRDDGTRRTTRYDIDLTKCIFCGFCEESCPVDSIVETHIHEYHGEKRGDACSPRTCCSPWATATKPKSPAAGRRRSLPLSPGS